MKNFRYLIIVLLSFVIFSCNNEKKQLNNKKFSAIDNKLIGKKIKPMMYAVNPYYEIDSAKLKEEWSRKYKIIVYGNLYCNPCQRNLLIWNKYYYDFSKYKKIAILFYLHATAEDFDEYSLKDSVNFPVILDYSNRFKIVNSISNVYTEQTFLLDSDNKIIAVGQPFDSEIKSIYLSLIAKQLTTNKK